MRKFILFLYLFITFYSNASAEEYKNDKYHYRITMPARWKEYPPEILDSLQKKYYYRYDACFSTKEGLFEPPYILLYSTPRGHITQYTFFENVDFYLNEHYYGTEDRQFEIKNFSQMVFDPLQNEYVIDTIKDAGFVYSRFSDDEEVGERKQIAAIFIGSEWITYIWGVSFADEFDRLLPTFKLVFESFEFEDYYTYYYAGERVNPDIPTQNFYSKAYRFGFSYPFGWKEISENYFKNNRRDLGGIYVDLDLDFPKIAIKIHFIDLTALTFLENAKYYIKEISGKNRFKRAEYMEISQIDLNNVEEAIIIDTIKKAVFRYDTRNISNEETIKEIMGVFMGCRTAVYIDCAATADEFDKFLPLFKIVFDSFGFNSDREYYYAGTWFNLRKLPSFKWLIALFVVLAFLVVLRLRDKPISQ
ncbi:MAG: hypothetical protein KAX05_00650 [Bacteroidales bacterium]|nr:hypothetical protein [Bacteroidales bacterium]